MKLYDYVLSADCYAVRLLASLTGQKLETVAVDYYPGAEHQGEDFRHINPAGSLPVLADGALTLSEPAAILAHLAGRQATAPARPDFSATGPLVAEWLARSRHFAAHLGGAREHDMLCQPGDIDALRRQGILWLRILESALWEARDSGQIYLTGPRPSIADIAIFPHVALAPDGGISLDPYPSIRLWMRALRSLPGFIEMPGIHRLHDLKPEPGEDAA